MLVNEVDIYRSAKVINDQYGEGAILEAMGRVERYRAFGSEKGMRVWERIADAIEFLQMPANLTGETIQ